MATLKTIRKRIISVRNTQKITKAMKMVAAAKLRRAQQAVSVARPYADRMKDILASIRDKSGDDIHSFFMEKEGPKRACILVFTSNRGLCGGFNSNLLRRVEAFVKNSSTHYDVIDLEVIGRKGRDFFKARKREVKDVYVDYAESFPPEEALKVATKILKTFEDGVYSEYYLAYNHFRSALVQEVHIDRLLPFSYPKPPAQQVGEALNLVDYIYEPSKADLVFGLIPKYLVAELYRAHRESLASELGSRMTAMENATNNAKDMMKQLTLQYNRLRQAAITIELMDIVNGAESIK